MKKVLDLFPFVLLFITLPYFFYSNPSIAQSCISIALVAYCGYQCYLIEKRDPDYEKKFEKALMFLEQEIKRVEKKTSDIRAEVAKSNVDKISNISGPKKFQF